MRENECYHILSILSNGFPVHGPKNFPGLSESTALTRSFSDQGVRLRVRKEPRSLLRKRGPASDNYVPRSYNRQRLQQEILEEQTGEGDSPISSRHSQPEQQVSMQSPQQIGPGRDYEQSFGSYSEEPAIKRPRTGSEQIQQQRFGQESQQYPYAQQSHQMTFGHQRPSQLVTPSQSPRSPSADSDETVPDPNVEQSPSYDSYHTQSQQQQAFVDYTPGGTPVGGYFPPQGPITSSSQQSEPVNFHQSHSLYQPHPYGGQFSSQVMQGANNTYTMGVADGLRRPGMGEMAPRFSRTPSVPGYIPAMGGDRRASYGVPAQTFTNQNLSAGMPGISRGSSVQPPITTGPGSMDNTYQ